MGTLVPVLRALNKLQTMGETALEIGKVLRPLPIDVIPAPQAVMLLGTIHTAAVSDILQKAVDVQEFVRPMSVFTVGLGNWDLPGTWVQPTPRRPAAPPKATAGTLAGDLRILLDDGYTADDTAAALAHLVSLFPFGRVFGGDWPSFNGPAAQWGAVVDVILRRELRALRGTTDTAGRVYDRLLAALRTAGAQELAGGRGVMSKRGPKSTPARKKNEACAKWLAVEGWVNQDDFCDQIGIGASTLRGWLKGYPFPESA